VKLAGDSGAFFLVRFDQFLTHRGKRLFGQLPFGDVDGRTNVTSKRPVDVVARHARCHHPAIFAVVVAESMLQLKDLPLLEGLLVHRAASLRVVRVEDRCPSLSQHRLQWQSGVIEPGLIEIRDLFLGARHPDHDRSGVGDEAEAFLRFPAGPLQQGCARIRSAACRASTSRM
jgi:hypothetical protein